jgi:hypothetical protein
MSFIYESTKYTVTACQWFEPGDCESVEWNEEIGYFVYTERGRMPVHKGDYIVKDNTGKLSVETELSFISKYRPHTLFPGTPLDPIPMLNSGVAS